MEIIEREPRLPMIKTRRLLLRDIRLEDISTAYVAWLNDPAVVRCLEIRLVPQTRQRVEQYCAAKLADTVGSKHFGVYDQDGTRLVGTITFPAVNRHHRFADLSFVIGHPDVAGRGYATEAVHGAIYYMFMHAGMEMLWAGFYEGHVGSEKVLRKNGFQLAGRVRDKYLDAEGRRVAWILVDLLRTEFCPSPSLLGSLV
jgi:RimJ/RimL family protein N-acetyltransferase